VTSISFQHAEPVNVGKLQDWIADLVEKSGPQLLRYKGIINVMHMSRKFVFQGVHMLFDGGFMDEWDAAEKRETRFVFIGKNLDKDELVKGFLACKVEDPELRFDIGTFFCFIQS
jgi:G3E family GTPase